MSHVYLMAYGMLFCEVMTNGVSIVQEWKKLFLLLKEGLDVTCPVTLKGNFSV